VDEVTRSLSVLGEDYVLHFTKMVNSGHVDVYPTETKRSGAAENTYSKDYLPWVYFNYKGYSEDISNIAHEFGHAVYDMYSVENQYPKYTQPTILFIPKYFLFSCIIYSYAYYHSYIILTCNITLNYYFNIKYSFTN
jgi:oligoendopeptidase F